MRSQHRRATQFMEISSRPLECDNVLYHTLVMKIEGTSLTEKTATLLSLDLTDPANAALAVIPAGSPPC